MRFKKMFIPTIREAPSDTEVVSHTLMVRSGMIRRVAAGVYNLLPLGVKALRNVESIVREEMNRAGAQEVLMPMIIPSELWCESGRWDVYGKELLRLTDRHKRSFCIGPTHEEVITDMIRRDVRSYRDLPLNLYQIQTKFRDEIRPRFGLMRAREFAMKDAYSFHTTNEDAEREYRNMYDTYCRIFERCGLRFRAVEADAGAIGGNFSHEFMVLAETGEDVIASCNQCNYAANQEKAETRQDTEIQTTGVEQVNELEKIATPGMKSVEEVSGFLKVSPNMLIKTLIYSTDIGPVAALVRGDYELNETKLKRLLNAERVTLADEHTVVEITKAPSGFAGPVGLDIRIVADHTIKTVINGVTGANEADTHFVNVNFERDFKVECFGDIRMVVAGDQCPRCDGKLGIERGIEVGHIFKLGTKYSKAMGATYLDEGGKEQYIVMGCYGIGIGRIAAASIEQSNDEKGIIWPVPLAPFHVYIVPVNTADTAITETSENVYSALTEAGLEVLLDDREERPGVKFKDADLLGIPIRITVSNKTLKNNGVEIKKRNEDEIRIIEVNKVVKECKEALHRR